MRILLFLCILSSVTFIVSIIYFEKIGIFEKFGLPITITINNRIISHKLCNLLHGDTLHNITVENLHSKSSGIINGVTGCFAVYEHSTGDSIIKTFDNFAFEIIKGSIKGRFYYISNHSLYF